MHLIRASMRFVSYKDRKKVAAELKKIYTAPNEDAALEALGELERGQWGRKYPHTVATWTSAWERFTPFLAFPPMLRRVIYTTNSIESLNYQLRKISKNRGHFPSTQGRRQTAMARNLQYRGQTGRRTRQRTRQTRPHTKSSRPSRRRTNRHELETSPGPAHRGLPRPNQPLPLTINAYTENLTLIMETPADVVTHNLTDGAFSSVCLGFDLSCVRGRWDFTGS